jgi:hypothetical protein
MRLRTAVVVTASGIVLATSGVGLANAFRPQLMTAGDIAAARGGFEDAMNLRQGVTGANVPAAQVASASQLAAMMTDGTAKLGHRFKGAELTAQLKALKQAHDMNASRTFRSAGGSADHFVYSTVSPVDATHLSLAGSYVAHSRVFIPDRTGALVEADPSNVLDFTAMVEKDAATGEWVVTAFDWTFAPGSEP